MLRTPWIILILLSFSFTINAEEELTFALGEFKPLVGKSYPDMGTLTKKVDLVLKEMGIKGKYEFYPWGRSYKEVLVGRSFGTFPWLKTPEREAKFLFNSIAIGSNDYALYYKKSKFPSGLNVKNWKDLRKYTIGCVNSYSYLSNFEKENIKCVLVSQEKQSWAMLLADRVEVFIQNQLVGTNTVKTKKYDSEYDITFEKVPHSMIEAGDYYLMVSRKDSKKAKEFLNKFDKTYNKLIREKKL